MKAKISNFWILEFMLSDIFSLFSLSADKKWAKRNWKVKFTKFIDIYNGNALKKLGFSIFWILNIIQLFVGGWFFWTTLYIYIPIFIIQMIWWLFLFGIFSQKLTSEDKNQIRTNWASNGKIMEVKMFCRRKNYVFMPKRVKTNRLNCFSHKEW